MSRKTHSRNSSCDAAVCTIPFSDSVAVRVYSDTEPRNGKIAELQKGLVFVYNGVEIVGEGTGFGLPVIVYSGETYFSATSKAKVTEENDRWLVVKEFTMDRIPRNRFRNVKLENRKARAFIGHLSSLYQDQPRSRFLVLKELTRRIQIGTVFVETDSLGKVTVTYEIRGRHVHIEADFSDLERRKLQKIFMLNEQASTIFRCYIDSRGTELVDERIGAWDQIRGEWASMSSSKNGFGFRLWKKENGVLRRGREYIRNSLDWAGLDYEISPGTKVFDYTIEILGA